MALYIKNTEVDRMARELARRRGISITAILRETLERELERERRRMRPAGMAETLMSIGAVCAALPTLDDRSDEDTNLNFGDCAAYALAATMGAPLLFKGDDFAATDIQPV